MTIQTKDSFEKGLVSVVMSNYNTPVHYLKAAVDSVLGQTYTSFEFIIIDDGSTDGSTDVIRSYTDPRIKLICNEENIGLTRSLNKGFALCKGEFIARMDADDICYPERFEEQTAFLGNHPDVIVCGTWVDVIDETGKIKTETGYRDEITDMESYRIFLLFGNRPTIMHPSAMFNHKMLVDHHIKYHEEYRYSQDYRMWISCSRYARCAIISKYLLKYRRHSAAIASANLSEQDECAFRIIQEQLDALHLKLPEEIKPIHLKLFYKNAWLGHDIRLKKWFGKIIKANRKYKVYNQKKLKKILWSLWAEICGREMKRAGLKTRCYILSTMPLESIAALLKTPEK